MTRIGSENYPPGAASASDKKRAVGAFSRASAATIPGFPNAFPYSEMALDGKLKLGSYGVKTRKRYWSHRGLTLFYSSGSTEKLAAARHGYDPKSGPRRVIVGVGELVDVRELTREEIRTLTGQFNNMSVKTAARFVRIAAAKNAWPADDEGNNLILPCRYGYFFRDLRRFETPVPFAWPSGAVTTTHIPVSVVAKALREIGVRPPKA